MKWLRMRSNYLIIWNDYVWEVISYEITVVIIWSDYVWEVIT